MNGVLLIDKPAGITSRRVDNIVRSRVGRRARVGHAGTLDPFATGLLPIMIGEATKLSPYLTGDTKVYEATLSLGAKTDTGDVEGAVVETAPVKPISDAAIEQAMQALTGELLQAPPAFSALKKDGRRLYDLARAGTPVAAAARPIKVERWRLLERAERMLRFEVVCGAGTYVRTLGEELAAALGTVGHLTALRRTAAGALSVGDAVSLDDALERLPLHSVESVLRLPALRLGAGELEDARHGRPFLAGGDDPSGAAQALDSAGRLVAIVEREGDRWRVARGFHPG